MAARAPGAVRRLARGSRRDARGVGLLPRAGAAHDRARETDRPRSADERRPSGRCSPPAARCRARRPAAADGHRQRDARLVLGRAACTRRSRSASSWPHALLEAGADVIDIGGESGVTEPARGHAGGGDRARRAADRARAPASSARSSRSTPTSRRSRAAAIAAGAAIVNDVSGLRDPELADVCAETGAALVLMHTRAAPKQKLLDRALDGRVRRRRRRVPARADRARARARSRVRAADARSRPGLRQDAGADRRGAAGARRRCTRSAGRCCSPSRARTSSARSPAARRASGSAGTLAAVAHGVEAGAHMFRVHDVGHGRRLPRRRTRCWRARPSSTRRRDSPSDAAPGAERGATSGRLR